MNRTRWKLAAGALAVSFGGLAAIADMPARTEKQAPAPVAVPVLPVIPAAPAPVVLTAADLPVLPVPAAVCPVAEVAPPPRRKPEAQVTVTELTLPLLAEPVPAGALVLPVAAAEPVTPVPPPAAVVPAPVAVTVTPAVVVAAPTAAAPPKPEPAVVITPAPVPAPAAAAKPVPEPFVNEIRPAQPAADAPPMARAAGEKKLKVLLHMGDDRPWFEVRDGNEVYLKVVCDAVDVKSPVQRGDAPSLLRATGKVFFLTPGGEGLCDELTVTPGTGQVAVCGKVAFTYNWGKTETTVSGDKMTFRLGTAPGTAAGAALTVPAGYERAVR